MSYRVPDGVHAREVDGEAVVLDSLGDRYFGLNRSGLVVWRRLSAGGTPSEAERDLVNLYAIPVDQARADVADLLRRLLDAGLLAPAEEG